MNATYYVAGIPYSAELYHHGIKGQKWGIRRFQNEDGTLTAAGKERYSDVDYNDKYHSSYSSSYTQQQNKVYELSSNKKVKNNVENVLNNGSSTSKDINNKANDFSKKTSQINDLFYKYLQKMNKETGKEFSGDGTEAHEELVGRYPEYASASKQYDKSKAMLVDSIKNACNSGHFDKSLGDTSGLFYRSDISKYKWTRTRDGRAEVIGNILNTKYGVYLFDSDFDESYYLSKGKIGKKIEY